MSTDHTHSGNFSGKHIGASCIPIADYITRLWELYYREFDKDGYAAVDTTYENIKDFLTTLATEQFEAGKAAGRNEAVDYILSEYDKYNPSPAGQRIFESARNQKSI